MAEQQPAVSFRPCPYQINCEGSPEFTVFLAAYMAEEKVSGISGALADGTPAHDMLEAERARLWQKVLDAQAALIARPALTAQHVVELARAIQVRDYEDGVISDAACREDRTELVHALIAAVLQIGDALTPGQCGAEPSLELSEYHKARDAYEFEANIGTGEVSDGTTRDLDYRFRSLGDRATSPDRTMASIAELAEAVARETCELDEYGLPLREKDGPGGVLEETRVALLYGILDGRPQARRRIGIQNRATEEGWTPTPEVVELRAIQDRQAEIARASAGLPAAKTKPLDEQFRNLDSRARELFDRVYARPTGSLSGIVERAILSRHFMDSRPDGSLWADGRRAEDEVCCTQWTGTRLVDAILSFVGVSTTIPTSSSPRALRNAKDGDHE